MEYGEWVNNEYTSNHMNVYVKKKIRAVFYRYFVQTAKDYVLKVTFQVKRRLENNDDDQTDKAIW